MYYRGAAAAIVVYDITRKVRSTLNDSPYFINKMQQVLTYYLF